MNLSLINYCCYLWAKTLYTFQDKHRDDTHKQRQALAKKLGELTLKDEYFMMIKL